jgi:hypothetical protein
MPMATENIYETFLGQAVAVQVRGNTAATEDKIHSGILEQVSGGSVYISNPTETGALHTVYLAPNVVAIQRIEQKPAE